MKKHEAPVNGFEHRLRQTLSDWRDATLGLKVDEKAYDSFGNQLVNCMRGVQRDLQRYDEQRLQPVEIDRLTLFADIVQDGCARLFADWREGLEYDTLRKSLDEEKRIWFEQLQTSD